LIRGGPMGANGKLRSRRACRCRFSNRSLSDRYHPSTAAIFRDIARLAFVAIFAVDIFSASSWVRNAGTPILSARLSYC
jgi:hypothetical protein